jgi:uncharacterized protein YukE
MNVSQEEAENLLRNLNSAINDIRKTTGGKAAEGAEKKYGIAYQACVRAGIKPKLRKKYRGGV